MGEKLRKWLRLALFVFAIICIGVFAVRFLEDQKGEQTYNDALDIATRKETVAAQTEPVQTEQTEPPVQIVRREWKPEPVTEEDEHIIALEEIDLKALQEVNPDVIGWIFVPQTHINYPIMQGEDNEFYLYHTWEKASNGMGSVFMECRNDADYSDFNTILYGHNMNSGAMFADITRFSSPWYYSRNPYVYLVTEEGILRYEVFSCHKTTVDSFVYQLSFNQKETREEFIQSAKAASRIETEVEPVYTDRILSLSTCSTGGQDARWVVHAQLKMVLTEVE